MIGSRFVLHRLLAQATTAVFAAQDTVGRRSVAVKVRTKKAEHLQLWWEEILLTDTLVSCPGVPRVIYSRDYPTYSILVLQPLGVKIADYLEKLPPGMDRIDTLKQWTPKLLGLLHSIHQCGVIHRDIHPDNLIVVVETGELYFIDFGVAHRTKDAHRPPSHPLGLTRFSSKNQLLRKPLTFEDDFESLCYSLYALEIGVANFLNLKYRPAFKVMQAKSKVIKYALAKWSKIQKM